MHFSKDIPRVVYKRDSLLGVIFQARFPDLLKLAIPDVTTELTAFQDQIRERFSEYSMSSKDEFQLSLNFATSNNTLEHHFASKDNCWMLTLHKNFISIVCRDEYPGIIEFSKILDNVLSCFIELYKPKEFRRIGFRYQNLIIRSRLELDDTEWSELLTKFAFSELHLEDINDKCKALEKRIHLQENKEFVNLRLLLDEFEGVIKGKEIRKDEECCMIDIDCYTDEHVSTKEEVYEWVNTFNGTARNLFRQAITSRLHDAMQP